MHSNRITFLLDSFQVFIFCFGMIYPLFLALNGFKRKTSDLSFSIKLPVAFASAIVLLYWLNFIGIFFSPGTIFYTTIKFMLFAMGILFVLQRPLFAFLIFLSFYLQIHVYYSNNQLGWMTYRNNDPTFYEFIAEYLKNHSFHTDVDPNDHRYSMNIVRQFVSPNSSFRVGHSVWDSFISNFSGISSIRTVYLSASIPLAIAIVSGVTALRALVWDMIAGRKVAALVAFLLIGILSLNRSILDLIFDGFYPATHAIAWVIMCLTTLSVLLNREAAEIFGDARQGHVFLAVFMVFAATAAVYPEILPFVYPVLGLVTLVCLRKVFWKRSLAINLGAILGTIFMFPSLSRLMKGLSGLSGLTGQLLLNIHQYWLYSIGATELDYLTWSVAITLSILMLGCLVNLLRKKGATRAERICFGLFAIPLAVGGVFLFKYISQGNQYTVVRTLTIMSPLLIFLVFSQASTWGADRFTQVLFVLFCGAYLTVVSNSVEAMKKILKVSLQTTRDQILLLENLKESDLLRGKTVNAEAAPQSILFQHYLSYLELVTGSVIHFKPHPYNYGHPGNVAWLGLQMDELKAPADFDYVIIPNACAKYETALEMKRELENPILFKKSPDSKTLYLAQSRSDWYFRPCRDLELQELKMVEVNSSGQVVKDSLPPFAVCNSSSDQKVCKQVDVNTNEKVTEFLTKNTLTRLTQ